MKRTHLGIQTIVVVVLIALVSWPEFRPVRALSVWRLPVDSAQGEPGADALSEVGSQYTTGAGARAAGVQLTPENQRDAERLAGRSGLAAPPRFVTPLAVAALGATLNALTGRARTSLNTPIPYARLVLRNIRTGQIEGRVTANEEGIFQFLDVSASAYIVELLGADGSIVAASEMVALANGDVREATVRVSVSAASVLASFGNALTSTLPQATDQGLLGSLTRTAGVDARQSVSPTL